LNKLQTLYIHQQSGGLICGVVVHDDHLESCVIAGLRNGAQAGRSVLPLVIYGNDDGNQWFGGAGQALRRFRVSDRLAVLVKFQHRRRAVLRGLLQPDSGAAHSLRAERSNGLGNQQRPAGRIPRPGLFQVEQNPAAGP
jgi:hypothetical protein